MQGRVPVRPPSRRAIAPLRRDGGLLIMAALSLWLGACAADPAPVAAALPDPAPYTPRVAERTPATKVPLPPASRPKGNKSATVEIGSISIGMASWYGQRYNGQRTASGERFDMRAATAAHPTLPFGTKVRVTNLGNGRSVVVRVNDRGPFTKRRIIDVSWAAARSLGFISDGLARVRVEVVAAPS